MMNTINEMWTSHRTQVSFTIMTAILLFVGFNQSWVLALGIFNLSVISSIMALGVNIQWGYAGLFNVGIMGFAALGGLSVVLISQQPVTDAIEAGGFNMLIALMLGVITVVVGVVLHNKKFNKWVVFGAIFLGFFAMRYFFTDGANAIEKVNPAGTGYLGGLGLPVLLSWIVGGFAAAGVAWGVGKITLGLRSDYLAIATLGISEIIIYVIKNEDWLSRGVKNVTGLTRPVPYELELQKTPWFQDWAHYFDVGLGEFSTLFVKLCYAGIFVSTLIGLIIMANLALDSPWGRKVRAIRDNEVSAAAMGKNITRQHLQIFVIGSAIVGLAGAMLVTYNGLLNPTSYQPLRFTFLIWVMVIVGGSGNNLGSVIGAFIIWFLWIQAGPMGLWIAEVISNFAGEQSSITLFIEDRVHHLRLVFMGAIMLMVMRFTPGGILPEKNKEL
jgi:branched-chain amino acid transport system permease protein